MYHALTIAGLGPGDPGLMTAACMEALRNSPCILLRTARHPVAEWLEQQSIAFDALDALYEESDDFDELCERIVNRILEQMKTTPVLYAVSDTDTDRTVPMLLSALGNTASCRVLPGVSMASALLASLPGDARQDMGYRVLSATDALLVRPDPSVPQLILEIDTRETAGLVKLHLIDLYPEEMTVQLRSVHHGTIRVRAIPLFELDRQKQYDHETALCLPAVPLLTRTRFTFRDLMDIMHILRGENGCSWDRKQTHESLRPYLLEEAYEAAGAIDEQDPDHLCEELGDVLLQIAFHASIAEDHGTFTDTDVITAICRKMIHRHPDVFGSSSQSAQDTWDTIKKEEQGLKTQSELLQAVSKALPALTRAEKVQKRAVRSGLVFPDSAQTLQELDTRIRALATMKDQDQIIQALGGLLFDCVNFIRLSGADPEATLNQAIDAFVSRFKCMEEQVLSDGKSLEHLTLSEMDVYWSGAKIRNYRDVP